jgi:hypothetical protein
MFGNFEYAGGHPLFRRVPIEDDIDTDQPEVNCDQQLFFS